MLKKYVLIILVIIMFSAMGAGCDCSNNNNNASQAKYQLTVWHVFDDDDVMRKLIDNYEKQNPEVEINYVKKDFAEYEQESLDAIAAGKGPDIWMIRNDWVYRHYDKLEPMTQGLLNKSSNDTRTDIETYTQTYPDIAVEDCVINDTIYGLPLSIDTLALYYNRDDFSDSKVRFNKLDQEENAELFINPPNNWDQLVKVSKLLTEKDDKGNITHAGIALGNAANISNATDILAALMLQNNTNMNTVDKLTAAFNLPITKETGEPVYPGTEALNFFTSFANPDKDNYTWSKDMPNSLDAFMQGKVSMIIDYGYARNRLEQEAPNLKYDIGPLPQINGATESVDYASYWVETVTKNSKYPKNSWAFIKYLKSNASTYDSATNRPKAKRINTSQIPQTKLRADYNIDPFTYQPMTAAYWYKGKYPIKVDNAFYDMIQDVVVNNVPLQKSIDKAASVVTELYKLSAQDNSVQQETTEEDQ